MITPPSIPLDLLFYADQGVDLLGDTVRRWKPIKGQAFMEEVEEAARPRFGYSGMQPVVRFTGKARLFFRGFGQRPGTHTFFFVARQKSGTLLDLQGTPILIPAVKSHWQVYEVTQGTDLPINEATLGALYHGEAGFFKGDIAAFGYKAGLLQKGQREYVHQLLGQKLGEAEKGFWSIHIPKPRWKCLSLLIP